MASLFVTFVKQDYGRQEAMENFVFPDKCSFMLIAMAKSLNKSTVDQQTLQSLWGCLGDNHWAQSVLRSLSIDWQIKTYQIFHIWDSRLGHKASFMKGVERGILNIANYSIVRFVQYMSFKCKKGKCWLDFMQVLQTTAKDERGDLSLCLVKKKWKAGKKLK